MWRAALAFLVCLGISQTAMATGWGFSESIVDQAPLADDRINELAIGDLNGDRRPDIWVSGRNGSGHQAAWYANPGDRLAPWPRFTLLEGSWKYGALGDLDGDGDLDLAAGFDSEGKLYWCENDGSPEDGGWTKHFTGLSATPDQVFISDMDGDGRPEVIAADKDGPVRILRRAEDPHAPWSVISLAGDADGAAGASIGDVDDDGDPDIVFGHRWYENPLPEGDWTAGDWTVRPIDEDWPAEARSAVADVDGDGRNDVVLSGEESDAGVAWYRAADPRAGSWQKTVVTGDYSKVHSLAVADFDGDGRADILAAEMHTSPDRRVAVFEQGADPDIWHEHVVATSGAHNAKVADLDGDGRLDIAGKNFEDDMRPRVWFSGIDPEGRALDGWRRIILEEELPHRATFVRPGDLDGDGLPDVAAAAWWWSNPGDLTGEWRRVAFGGDLQNVTLLYDLDSDGDLDALGTDGAPEGDAFFWAENDGTGAFTVHAAGPRADGDFLQGAEAGRLLGSEAVQVVLSWHNGQRTEPVKGTQWFEVPADPRESWAWARIHDFSNEEQIDLGDLDGDGDLDVHLGIDWLRNDGDGTFTRQAGVALSKGEIDRLRLGDLDGDGDLDVVIGAEDANWLVWGEHPGGDGTGAWSEHPIAADFRHMSLDVADLDGDGDLDVVSGEHKGRGRAAIYENDGQGRLWTRHTVDPGLAPKPWGRLISRALDLVGWPDPKSPLDHHNGTQLADLDGDGDLDLVSVGWLPPILVIYENRGDRRSDVAGRD